MERRKRLWYCNITIFSAFLFWKKISIDNARTMGEGTFCKKRAPNKRVRT